MNCSDHRLIVQYWRWETSLILLWYGYIRSCRDGPNCTLRTTVGMVTVQLNIVATHSQDVILETFWVFQLNMNALRWQSDDRSRNAKNVWSKATCRKIRSIYFGPAFCKFNTTGWMWIPNDIFINFSP